MPINVATKGSNISSYANFFNPDGTPFQPTTPVRWVVRDFNQNQISTGIATQNIKLPAQWTCSFVLPLTAPSTTNNSYSLVWLAGNQQGTQTASEYFQVTDELEQQPFETAQVALLNQQFVAKLWLPFKPGTLSLRMCTEKGTVTYAQSGLSSFNVTPSGTGYSYSISINPSIVNINAQLNFKGSAVPPSAYGVTSMFLYWNYTDSQTNQETVINRLYVVNGTMIRMMDDLRRFLDRIRNAATIPQLQLTDVDLAHFALQGMDKFNGTPPANNGCWGLGNLPEPFYENVKMAACIRFLQSQYLAMGMASFEFSGQAVTLNSDQTQYLQSLESTLSTEYDSIAQTNKKAIIRSSYFASIGGYFGPTALMIARVPYGFASSFNTSLPFLGNL